LRLARWSPAAAFLAFGSLSAAAVGAQEIAPPEQYHLRLEFARWTPKLGADLQIGAGGTLIDVKQDLGLRDERAKVWSGALQFARGLKLRASRTPLDYQGDVAVQRAFSFQGTSYEVADRVVSSLKGQYYTGALELDFVRTRAGYLGLMIGAQVFDYDAILEIPARGIREQSSKIVPIPVVGATGRLYFGRLSVSGEISGLTIGKRGHVYEASAAAGVHVSDRLALKGGYRRFNLHGENEPDLVDLTMEGWHFGAEVSF
jgi:hypothetical protein